MVTQGISFNPSRDIPSLQGKVILITGGNIGIGKQTALELSKHNPSELWIAARNAETSNAVVNEIKNTAPGVSVKFLKLDLTSFDSVKDAARTFLSSVSRLDILILNAGIMGGPASLTKEGYELRFGTNHMGHAVFFKLLAPLLIQTAERTSPSDVHVVWISSVAHKFVPDGGIQFDSLKTTQTHISTITRYGQSKLANLLYAREVAKHYPQFTTVSLHPGNVKTNLAGISGSGWFIKMLHLFVVPVIGISVEEGAKNQLWAATADGVKSGEYYEPIGVTGKASVQALDEKFSEKLWDWTQKDLEGHSI